LINPTASSLKTGPGGTAAHSGKGGSTDIDGHAKQKKKDKCPHCAPPGDQSIYVPLIDLPEAQGGELVFNSRSTKDMAVTPIFYKRDGAVVTGDPVTVRPGEIRYADVRSLIPAPHRHEHDWGGMSLAFHGTPREIWSQFRFLGVGGGGSVDEFFVVPNEQRAETQEAAWRMPSRSRAVIALGNLTGGETAATVDFGDGEAREVRLAPHATEIVRREHTGGDGVESVKISVTGAPGSVVPTGLIESQDNSFNSVIRFYDSKSAKQPNLFANGLRLAGVTPHMVLKNTTSAAVTARPRFIPAGGDGAVVLPEVRLGANEAREVELTALLQAAGGRSDLDVVSAEVTSSGAPGSLIGSLHATDNSTGVSYDVPLRDSGPIRSMTGAYPWIIGDDFRTVVYITNINDKDAEFVGQLNYDGGKFIMSPRKLKPGETAVFDLQQMRDEQAQDSAGNTLPGDVLIGQFMWAQRGVTGGKVVLIGRSEVVSRSRQVSSSYSCPQDCGLSYSLDLNPFPDPSVVGGAGSGTAWETGTSNTGYTVGPYQSSADWSVDNPIVSFQPSSAATTTATGTSAGDATLTAFAGLQDVYDFDGLECVFLYTTAIEAVGSIPVRPSVLINGPSGVPLAGTAGDVTTHPPLHSIQLTGTGNPSGGTFSWSVLSGAGKVSLSNTSSDTATVNSLAESSVPDDVTIELVYVVNGRGNDATHQLTVQKPTFMGFINVLPGSDGPNTCSNNPVTGQPRAGWRKSITWQLQDRWHQPMPSIPTYDTLAPNNPNDCDLVLSGTPPGTDTAAGGIWIHDYTMCTSFCVGQNCETDATQSYFANGFQIDLSIVFRCNGITVAGH
jgi:hypothetical protein